MGNPLDKVVEPIKADWVSHIYYDQAEQQDFLDIFWGEGSRFARAFAELDRASVVEIACGHGRHGAQIVDTVGSLLLLDINEGNIEFCRKRFHGRETVRCEVNNGYDLQPAATGSADAIFSYDAMVHFEPDVMASYLSDIIRVLKPGGRALLHHSAYSANPGAHYSANPHYRNYMTPDLFKHFALRAGLTVVSQEIFGWGAGDNFAPDIDALSILQR
jgi:SAM-dependent methyltransferase